MSLLVLGGLCIAPVPAHAQTAIQLPVRFTRLFTRTGTRVNDINLDDCHKGDVLSFEVQVFNPRSSANFQVWAGSNCNELNNRTGDNPRCWKVFQQQGGDANFTVEIPVQTIVAQKRPGDLENIDLSPDIVYPATIDDCKQVEETIGLYFMYVGSSEEASAYAVWPDLVVDTLGPAPPTEVTGSPGEERVFLKWKSASSSELQGYKFYCAPNGGSAILSGASLDAGAAASVSADAGLAGSGDAGSSVPPPVDMSTQASTAGDGGAGCSAEGLVEGALPTLLTECGKVTGSTSTSGTTSTLSNDVEYAVAVSAIDELDNPGRLSNVVCATPANITTFFDRYVDSGGTGGGGFCSVTFAGDRTQHRAVLAGLACAGLFAARRRRRSSQPSSRHRTR